MNFIFQHKKIFIAIGFILLVFVFGWMIYYLFFKTITAIPGEEISTTTPLAGGLPLAGEDAGVQIQPSEGEGLLRPEEEVDEIATGGLTETLTLNESPSMGITSNDSNVQYYNKSDGKFYTIDERGSISLLSEKIFHEVREIEWSPDKNKAILEYPDGANIIYDFETEKQTTLPTHWEDFEFSPTGDKIVMKSIGIDSSNRWLAIANTDGSGMKAIEPLGENAHRVQSTWSPNNQVIATYSEGAGFSQQKVYFVGMQGENFKALTVEGLGFQSIWSPEGDRMVYSVYSEKTDFKPSLWVTNAKGESIGTGRKSLNIQTWAEKCIFKDNINIYCAVPKNLEEGAGFISGSSKESQDELYEINIITGLRKKIAIPEGNKNISNPQLSSDGKYFFFNDGNDEKIYKIRLKQ